MINFYGTFRFYRGTTMAPSSTVLCTSTEQQYASYCSFLLCTDRDRAAADTVQTQRTQIIGRSLETFLSIQYCNRILK